MLRATLNWREKINIGSCLTRTAVQCLFRVKVSECFCARSDSEVGFLSAGYLIADEFPAELAAGAAYVAGHDVEGRPVLVTVVYKVL